MNSVNFMVKIFEKVIIESVYSVDCRNSNFVFHCVFYSSRFIVFIYKMFTFCLSLEMGEISASPASDYPTGKVIR